MTVNAIAAHRVVGPTALVDVPVRVVKLPVPTSLITVPGACVGGAVGPLHATFSVAEPTEPRPDVGSSGALVSVGRRYIVVDLDTVKTNTLLPLDCLFVLFGGEVLGRLLLIEHLLALEVQLEAIECDETSDARLELDQSFTIILLKSTIVDV